MPFEEFRFQSIDEVREKAASLGLQLSFSENLSLLQKKVQVGRFTVPNSLAVHPMEGCDGTADGRPDELTIRRYDRFSRGGAGLIWLEAVAVTREGRANPRQLWLHDNSLPDFKRLVERIRKNAQQEYGNSFEPLLLIQLTHSGRYSKPEGKPAPILAAHNPYLDTAQKFDPDLPVISDEELERLEDRFVEAAILAKEAGFQGVDVKACHRYLNSELLSAYTRKGRYGETFEGRTRFYVNVVSKIRDRLGKDFIVASRMNVHDAIPYPYGWGMKQDGSYQADYTEPIKLVKLLSEKGVDLVNLSMGNPYYNPHVNRPYDKGPYLPAEHPLEGVSRMVNGIGEVKKAVPEMKVIGTGYSWLRQFSPYLAAGSLETGKADLIGYGREAFAYPDFARDILQNGGMKREKCCIACGKCSEIMRGGGRAGCVIRDSGTYGPIYSECFKK